MNILITAAALAAASLSTVTAVGQAHASVPNAGIEVSYSDLDLSRTAGRQQLDERLEAAARRVCRTDSSFSLMPRASERDCREETVERAAEQVPFPAGATD